MKRKTLCICSVQSPFIRGGAEVLVDSLINELSLRGIEIEHIRIPLITYPKRNILQEALHWRLLDLASPILPEINLCVPIKFPAYAVKHPIKVPWLLHQFRDAYDIFNSQFYHFTQAREDIEIREAIVEIDNLALRECKHIYTISKTVSTRLLRYNGLQSEPLYPPPRTPEQFKSGPGQDYILSIGRLESIKRVDLLIRAMADAPRSLRCMIVGEGSQRDSLARLIEDLQVQDRVKLLGRLPDQEVFKLYSHCKAVYYAPYDEDYGYSTVEAFLSAKPVITCYDSGGTLEFVQDRQSGWIVKPNHHEIAETLSSIEKTPDSSLIDMGEHGRTLVKDITWDRVAACFSQFFQ